MYRRSIRLLIEAQLCLIAGLGVCVIIKPHGLLADDGISYYGIYKATIVPYAFALLGAGWCTFEAARRLPSMSRRPLRLALQGFAAATVGLTLTPYSVNSLFDWAHTTLGAILFASQLILTGWLSVKLRRQWLFVCLWALELLAGIACAIYVLPSSGYLIEFQILFQLLYTIFVVLYLVRTERT